MLAVTDDQHALAGTFTHHEFETSIGGIYGDEGDGAVIIFSRGNCAFPLAEIECSYAVFLQHVNVAQFLTVVPACQPAHGGRGPRHYGPVPRLGLRDPLG